ncbi:MAG: SPOR domain-containing protein [Betaproteobacteria bacterium]|nr:SPOR domain-containing protein [Betaproteobacteria bacterium]NBY33959.1 SPOR domain-containing protein [Betaproteobacteria bacterium]
MSDFYQSPADKLRFEILLKSLREGRLNLAILGDDEVALTYYGRRIFQHLREQGEPHVELWTSADSEKLVDRFNDILSELTVDQAVDKGNKAAPKRFMIFPDTQAIQEFELQLLARLVNGFPASNINLILLVNNQTSYEKKLATFGKNLLQWVLESEDPTPAKTQRIETRDDFSASQKTTAPMAAAAGKTFTLPPAPLPPLDMPNSEVATSKASALAVTEATPELDDSMEPVMGEEVPSGTTLSGEELAKEWADSAAASRRSTKIVAILLVAILGSLATFGFLYQDLIRQEAESLQDYLGGKKPVAQTKSDPAPAPAATVSMSSSNSPAAKSPDIVLSEKEELVSPSAPPASPSPPPPAAPEPVPAPSPPPAPAPAVEAKKKPEKSAEKPPEIAADKAAGADDPVWVSKLDADTWVLQHGAFDSLAEARAFQNNSSLFKSAQVLFSQRKGGKSFYIVLTGPYADKVVAETQMRQNPAMAKAWLRTSKSLKAQFQD